MSNSENVIQSWARSRLKDIYGQHCVYIKYPASQYSSRGVSDLIFCIHGLYIAIEVKTEKGRPTALQKKFGADVQQAGGFFSFMFGKDENVISQIKAYISNHSSAVR